MDMQDKPNGVTNVPDLDPKQTTPPSFAPRPSLLKSPVSSDSIKRLFQVTGGSSLYCISAVLIAYGIVKLLKPVLVESESLRDALPCLLTLHGYELALLAVLLWVVFKKVVDDALSLTVLIGLFLVGSSVALGSVADREIQTALYLGLAGFIIAISKFIVFRKFARIPFTILTIAALSGVMAYNYFGPALMARAVSLNASDEAARRNLWLLFYLLMLAAFLIVWIDAFRQKSSQDDKTPFLQSPGMAYVFALILLFGSGVHQYMMAYAFTLERVLLDYVPAAAVGCLILIEVLRLSGKGHIVWTIVITCIPGGLVLLAIDEQSVLSSGQWGLGLVAYPPVLLAGFGIAVAAVAYLRKSGWLWWIAAAYGMGVVLTYGFSPEDPYDLNYFGCCLVTSIILLGYGFIKRNPYICFAGIIVFCLGLPDLKGLPEMVKSWHLTEPGFFAGIIGLGTIALYLIFSKKLHQVLSVIGALAVAMFVYDYLPASLSARYIIVLIGMVALLVGLWIRTRDVLVMVIITIPLWIRGYVLTKILANWRYIIFGFIALIGGACLSTLKKPLKTETSTEESNQQSDEITG